MSENAPHKDFKTKLLQFLREDVAGQRALRWTDIAFPCNDHLHFWPMPPWAAWVESERIRETQGGVRYKPDIVILDDQDRPLAILEVTATNHKNNCQKAADELNIPWFRFWAPPSETTQAELATRLYPADYIGFTGGPDGFSSSTDGWRDEETGGIRYGMIYHSEVAPGSINIGKILYANSTNLTCEWAEWYTEHEQLWKQATWQRNNRNHVAQQIGFEILDAMEISQRNPQTFTAGIGSYQLHGNIGIYPLNPNPVTRAYDPIDIASLLEEWREADRSTQDSLKAFREHCAKPTPPFRSQPEENLRTSTA